ncbi:MAG TPA: hypothetical protein VIH99_13805 [Bdellovibrionota bacterium]|jgi:16S rRNA U516 pseudouridylate synthase RsuA-like enzyme
MGIDRRFLHDISSPLTTVHLNVENAVILLREGKPGEIKDCLEILQVAVTQLKRITGMIKEKREELIEAEQK